jgi:protein TonB
MADKLNAWMLSIVFHLLILLLAIVVKFELIPEEVTKQIEILDIQYAKVNSGSKSELIPMKKFGQPQMNKESLGQKTELVPKKVDLPKSRFQEDNPLEQFEAPEQDFAAVNPLEITKKVGNSYKDLQSDVAAKSSVNEKDLLQDDSSLLPTDDYLRNISDKISGTGDADSPFLLEGEITRRTIKKKVLPEYPEGIQKNVTIKIKFDVNPEGNVEFPVVLKKADPLLEKTAVDALKQWKFSRAPIEKNQTGYITFVFKLK